jgi:hypothetical protein
MSEHWSIIGEIVSRSTLGSKVTFRTIRKYVADTGFLTYDEADQERMNLTKRFPKVEFFVKREVRGTYE